MALLDNFQDAFESGGAFNNPQFNAQLINYLLARARPNSEQQMNQFPLFGLNNNPSYAPKRNVPSMDVQTSLSSVPSSGPFAPTQQFAPLQNIEMMRRAAEQVYPNNPTMQQVALSQAMLESGPNFNSSLARQNNFFGIKGAGDSGSSQYQTTEYVNGVPVTTKSRFSTNTSPEQSFEQYKKLITENSRYRPVLESKTPEEAFGALQRAGYATDPRYASKLNNIHRRYVQPLY